MLRTTSYLYIRCSFQQDHPLPWDGLPWLYRGLWRCCDGTRDRPSGMGDLVLSEVNSCNNEKRQGSFPGRFLDQRKKSNGRRREIETEQREGSREGNRSDLLHIEGLRVREKRHPYHGTRNCAQQNPKTHGTSGCTPERTDMPEPRNANA